MPGFLLDDPKSAFSAGARMLSFLSERRKSTSQAFSADLDLMVALLLSETKSSTSAMSNKSSCWPKARMLVVTGAWGESSCSKSACMRTKATIVSLQKRRQSSIKRRIMRGRRGPGHRHVRPIADGLAPKTGAHHVVEAFERLVFGLQPLLPIPLRLLIERRLHGVGADVVVNLPGDQLGMLPSASAMARTIFLA
jgi:hypothetical protein